MGKRRRYVQLEAQIEESKQQFAQQLQLLHHPNLRDALCLGHRQTEWNTYSPTDNRFSGVSRGEGQRELNYPP